MVKHGEKERKGMRTRIRIRISKRLDRFHQALSNHAKTNSKFDEDVRWLVAMLRHTLSYVI